MFERYTEKARRVIFFGQYEASRFNSPVIETQHLLLGLMREDKLLMRRALPGVDPEVLRQKVEERSLRGEVPQRKDADRPLTIECKRILAFAADEAERVADKHIGTQHLLAGFLHESGCLAAVILGEFGLTLTSAQKQIESPRIPPAHEDPDLACVIDRCAIIVEQEGYDAPNVIFKTMTLEEHSTNRLTALEVACRWLENKGWQKSKTEKRNCHAYYEKGTNRAYVTTNMCPLSGLIRAEQEPSI